MRRSFAGPASRRINVSLDSRREDRFRHITRRGDLGQVMAGIDAAAAAGLTIKINMVGLKGINEDEIEDMLALVRRAGLRPYPDRDDAARRGRGATGPSTISRWTEVRRRLEERFDLLPTLVRTGGPARYFEVAGMPVRLGLITPLTGNFCERLQPYPGRRDRHGLWLPRP